MNRHLFTTAVVATCTLFLVGCGSATASSTERAAPATVHQSPSVSGQESPAPTSGAVMTPGMIMPDGSTMGPMTVPPASPIPPSSLPPSSAPRATTTSHAATQAAAGPPAAAQMVCSAEIHATITKVLALTATPTSSSSWENQLYTCTYRLPMGKFVISVKQSASATAAADYARQLRGDNIDATKLNGLTATAFETPAGKVFLVKDDFTLTVDATTLPKVFGRQQQKRVDFAYEIASDILGCWTDD
ncbi:hypothetical protein SAMN04515671_4381 [Nakamurella panacisegetis]|uniref:DUF3558 domain-containing protein n=1 Tax=Nakamurella panacisegetis TaxID=1090615 RepID=A0A1H0T0A4_9ACTN|nr:hypothetical protein [Nakamurella panacisegetis]SDP47245.1 hypothetical protein SAMN04515671_4381 [Nakamurella panacisegetis]